MADYPILRTSQFDRAKLKTYWLLSPTIMLSLSVVLIPVIPVVVLIIWLVIDRYIERLSCELTTRTLEVRKGWLNRVESTVPLEKITDVQYYQGPIMRYLGLEGFRVETAGQSGAATGHLVNMIGIRDTRGFRQAVLAQRDALAAKSEGSESAAADPFESGGSIALLREIRDTLQRIEGALAVRDR